VYSRHTYYKFRNSMVHMVLYNLTPASSRKRMHKVIINRTVDNDTEHFAGNATYYPSQDPAETLSPCGKKIYEQPGSDNRATAGV